MGRMRRLGSGTGMVVPPPGLNSLNRLGKVVEYIYFGQNADRTVCFGYQDDGCLKEVWQYVFQKSVGWKGRWGGLNNGFNSLRGQVGVPGINQVFEQTYFGDQTGQRPV